MNDAAEIIAADLVRAKVVFGIRRLRHTPEIGLQRVVGGNDWRQDSEQDDEGRHTPPEGRQWVAPGKSAQATQRPAKNPSDIWDLRRAGTWQSFSVDLGGRRIIKKKCILGSNQA